MAVATKTLKKAQTPGAEKRTVIEVTFDNSYPTGGEPLTPKELGLRYVDYATVSIVANAGAVSVVDVSYDVTNQKLKAFGPTGEVANAADLSTVKVQVVAFGK